MSHIEVLSESSFYIYRVSLVSFGEQRSLFGHKGGFERNKKLKVEIKP